MPGRSSSSSVRLASVPKGWRGWRERRSPVFRAGIDPSPGAPRGPWEPQRFQRSRLAAPCEDFALTDEWLLQPSIDRALCFREATCLSPVNPCRPGSEQVAFCAPGSAPGQERSGEGEYRGPLSQGSAPFISWQGRSETSDPGSARTSNAVLSLGFQKLLALLRHAGESGVFITSRYTHSHPFLSLSRHTDTHASLGSQPVWE